MCVGGECNADDDSDCNDFLDDEMILSMVKMKKIGEGWGIYKAANPMFINILFIQNMFLGFSLFSFLIF